MKKIEINSFLNPGQKNSVEWVFRDEREWNSFKLWIIILTNYSLLKMTHKINAWIFMCDMFTLMNIYSLLYYSVAHLCHYTAQYIPIFEDISSSFF